MSNYQQYTVVELRELAMDRNIPEVMHSRYINIKKDILIELLEKYDREHRSTTNQEVMTTKLSLSNDNNEEVSTENSYETLTCAYTSKQMTEESYFKVDIQYFQFE